MHDFTHAYVATCQCCGNAFGICADRGDRDTAEFLQGLIESGGTIERMTIPEAQAVGLDCECGPDGPPVPGERMPEGDADAPPPRCDKTIDMFEGQQ